ncbi:unknown [Parabacteroides johnsonii CAG:246]|nr:unknown [Parabacteroides johnsonii CAG:246]
MPFGKQSLSRFFMHFSTKDIIQGPLFFQFIHIFPVTDRQPCQIGGTQSCCFENTRTDYRTTADIRLELHQKIIGNRSTIHTDLFRLGMYIVFHSHQDIVDLIANTFQGSTGQMGGTRSARDSDNGTTGILVPVRGSQSGQRRNKVDPAVIRHGISQLFRDSGALYQS